MRLRTLGGIYLTDATGQPVAGPATQRRFLALLAALAVAGDRGCSRDKLVALLWPEANEERGRHSLTQALYAARRTLELDDLFLVGADIRLNRQRLQSDVQELEAALEQSDLERAVALYGGPFADGFFLPGSGEFERWTSAHRTRLEDQIAAALDRLALQAEEDGRVREALDWRKRLAAMRPLDTSAAVALMTTLANAGDRAGALQHARLHEILLREQLGLAPDRAFASLVARLRESPDWTAEAGSLSGGQASSVVALAAGSVRDASEPPVLESLGGTWGERDARAAVAVAPESAGDRLRAAAAGFARTIRARWWWPLPVLAAAFGAVLLRRGPAEAPAIPAPAPLEQSVVVAPFRVVGAASSLAYLREGMVELLSTRLADDDAARSVDAGAVLAAWRAARLGSPTDVPRSTIVHLAQSLGAERVVIGSVVGGSERLVFTATVLEVPTQRVAGLVTVQGPADSLMSLVDRLAGELLVLDAGEDTPLAGRTTESLPALRSFLGGQAAFRLGNYSTALLAYEEALRLDSTFALAAVQLARAADRLRMTEPRSRALALAWRERDVLDARARALLVALAGPGFPMPSENAELLAGWERLIDLESDRAESWFEFGARLLQEGPAADVGEADARAVLALRRAVQLDSAHTPARELLAAVAQTSAGAARRSTLSAAPDSSLPIQPFLRWRDAVSRGDSTELRRVRAALAQTGPRNLRAIAVTAQLDGVALDDARAAIQQLRARADRIEERLDATLGEHALALNQGRVQDALAATERLAQLQPGSHAHLRLRILDALYGDGDADAGAAAAEALRRSATRPTTTDPRTSAIQVADACVLAQWRLNRADTSGVRQIIAWLRADPLQVIALAPPLSGGPIACAELLQAALVVAIRGPGASQRVARLDSLAFTAGVSSDAIAYAPVLIARLHARLGDAPAAFNAIRRREQYVGWPRYLATELREEGQYASSMGAVEAARAAFEHYLALRTQPDTGLRHQVEDVRRVMVRPGGTAQ